MGYTKRQFIAAAFEEVGLASYIYDLQPEQLQSALRKLDAMMATWNAKGIRLGYPIPSSPENSDLDTETEVPDYANEAIFLGLGIRISPMFGKNVSPDTKQYANQAYKLMLARNAVPPEMSITGLPKGAGHKAYAGDESRFLREPEDKLLAGPDSVIDFN